ncbi:MAG: AsmA family protein [Pseudooceanicola sp.]
MRVIKWVFLAVLAVVVAIGGAVFFLPGERIARIAADQIEARTGRAVRIAGETTITWWPVLGVITGAVEIANAGWSRNGPMFRAEALAIGVEAGALFGGDIRVTEVRATRPEVLLERNADGAANWDLLPGGDTGGAEAKAGARAFKLDSARITGASLHLIDAAAGTRRSFENVDLSVDWPLADGPVDFALTLRPAGDAVRVTGRVGDLDAFMGGGISALALRVATPGGGVDFDGRAGLAPEAQGRVNADLGDTAGFARALGLGPVDLPTGLGRKAALTGDVTFTRDRRLSLREGQLTLDGNTMTAAADLDLSGKPVIKAQLSGGTLDLAALGGDGGGGDAATAGWSTAPIDAGALGVADGEVALAFDRVEVAGLSLTPVRTTTRIDNARAVTELRQLGAFGGNLGGQFVVNNRSGLSMGGEVSARDVDLKTMLTDLAGVTRFTGTGAARVQFLATGPSLAALMNSLSGEGEVSTGRGTIEGIDLDRLLRTGQGTGGTTIFDSVEATFKMREGNLDNRDLEMKLASITATGEGRIGIGARDIDYLFTPTSSQARAGRGLAVPVRIWGPWSGPRIVPDLEKAIELNFDEERKALEEKAKQKVEEEVSERLGITREEGESAEDAVKRKLEKEALKGLRKLFGGD